MLELRLSTEVGSDADTVWAVVGSFNGLPEWHPWVVSSVLEPAAGGVGRRVTIDGGRAGRRELVERAVFFDGAAREYAYTILAGPVPFADYVGRFRVVPHGDGRARIEYHATYRAAAGYEDAEATERIRTFYEAGFANLPKVFSAVNSRR